MRVKFFLQKRKISCKIMNTRISIFRRLYNRFITLLSIRGRLFFFVPFSTFFDGDRVFASEGADCTMSGKKRERGIKMLVETRSIAAAQRACYDNGIIQCMISYATMVRKRVRMYRVILSPEYYIRSRKTTNGKCKRICIKCM